MTFNTISKCLLRSGAAVVALGGAPALAQDAAQPADAAAFAESEESGTTEIVVTARRKEESLQDVPVSISAFSDAALQRSTVQTVSDLNTITPGLRFDAEGGKNNASVSLRGLGQIAVGNGTPGVVLYFANIALPSEGSNVPTYDLANVQVLKGPQGTLFGRNTLGGAILVNPQAPTSNFEGYVQGTYGRFDYREVQGALNVPLGDFGAIRAAGQIRRQDGRTKSLDGGPSFDNVHQDSFRISLLLTPFDGLTNTTIYDFFEGDERAGGLYLYRQNVGAVPGLSAALDPQIAEALAIQRQNRRGAFGGEAGGGRAYTKAWGITNQTAYTFGDFTIRNLFGLRKSLSDQLINTGAVPTLALGPVPFTLFSAASRTDRQSLTNEVQFNGDFDGFNFILGYFYSKDKPNGPSGSGFKAFTPVAATRNLVTLHYTNTTNAVFGQVSVDLTSKLSLDLGGRYSWEKISSCGGSFAGGYASYDTCLTQAALGNATDGAGTVGTKSSNPSWTVALNYKLNDDVLLYGTTRRGVRAASVNTPLFESAFTTGGIAPGCAFTTPPATGQCPDLRPYQYTGVEKLTDFEIGMKSTFRLGTGRGHFNIAGFYNDYKGALQLLNTIGTGIPQAGVPDAPNRTAVGVNVADLTIWGIELDASVSPIRDITVSFNGAYTKTKIDKVTLPPLPGANFSASQITLPTPTFAGTLGVSWTLPFHPADGDLVFNSDIYMTDDFGGANGENLPGYALANARLDWKNIGGKGIDLGLYVRNLTNAFYYSSPSLLLTTVPIASVYVGEPRTWGLSARYSF